MGSLKSTRWPLVLVHMFLLQNCPAGVQGIDPVSQKLRRLTEQFQQFKSLTQARLNMLAQNQNRSSSWRLESRVQVLDDSYHHVSQDLELHKHTTTEEMGVLREWSRKLEKKCKRIEIRMAMMERNFRENHRQTQMEKPDPGQDFSNLSQELQSQEGRLAALQAQRDELLVGLKGLQESLKKQMLRVTQVEGQLDEILRDPPQRGGQTNRGGRPGRIPGGYYQPSTEENSQTSQSQARTNQHQSTNQPKHTKAQKQRPQPVSLAQIHHQHANPQPQSTDYVPLSDPYPPQSQIQTRPHTINQQHLQTHSSIPKFIYNLQTQTQVKLPQRNSHSHSPSQSSQPAPLAEPNRNRQSRTRTGTLQRQTSGVQAQPQTEPRTSRNDPKLPVRLQIPGGPLLKKDATMCNVGSVLFFPSPSAGNYITFSRTLPILPELSLCLWLRVVDSYIGTLLSYATDDNDNQLVLYGRNSSSSSTPHTSPFSPLPLASGPSPSLDFVVGDPVYRRLPMLSFADARWHHLCVLWSSIQGHFWHYSGSRLISSGSNFRKGWEIPGGGSVVLGQEQDTVGGGFDPAEGFAGHMAGFRLWNRVLSPSEVKGLAEGRGVPRGVVLGMEDIKEIHGEVLQVTCECLEDCV